MHDACRVVAASSPVLTSSDLGIAIASCLFDAKGHRYEGIVVWKVEQDVGAWLCRGDGRSWPPSRCFKRSIHPTQFDFGQDLIQHEFPMVINTICLELVADVLAILLFEVVHRGRLEILAILANVPINSRRKLAHERKAFRQLAIKDLSLWVSQTSQEVYQDGNLCHGVLVFVSTLYMWRQRMKPSHRMFLEVKDQVFDFCNDIVLKPSKWMEEVSVFQAPGECWVQFLRRHVGVAM